MGLPIVNPAFTLMRAGATRGVLEDLVLQETSRKKFYELEGALQMVARRRQLLPIHPKMKVSAGVQWPSDSETKCS